MSIIKGQYNVAKVYAKTIDDATREQIQNFVNHPAFKGKPIAIMPDCHAGKGSCIGFTMPLNDYIMPEVIGVDIGCGMLAANFGKITIDPKKLDAVVHERVPAGFNMHKESVCVSDKWDSVCDMIGISNERVERSVGTLGGGNHFIEGDYDDNGNFWIVIHTGSRNFGKCIAEYFHKKALELMKEYFAEPINKIAFIPKNSIYATNYIHAMQIAQDYARLSRSVILNNIFTGLGISTPIDEIDSVHNFIDEKDMIVRKGATSARAGERCVIPFNSMDGTAICTGKGNPEWNFSAPHGAGRLMSRKKAKENLSTEEMKTMLSSHGVYSTTANDSTLDESPAAYKPSSEIIEAIQETVNIDLMLHPFYNFKAAEIS